MSKWKLKGIWKKKLSEKDSNSFLGYCILKATFFDYLWEKKFLNEVSW